MHGLDFVTTQNLLNFRIMIAPAAYVLRVPQDRREILLDEERGYYSSGVLSVAEPVPRFDHSRRAPLIVLCCFEKGAITHIADGRKGASAGTGLVRGSRQAAARQTCV